MNTLLAAIHHSALSRWVVHTIWVWPTLEILHFMGLSLLIGALLVVDLRLFGFLPEMSLDAAHRLLPWVFVGFGVNVVSGALFFASDPVKYASNLAFQVKMALVLIAGVNALWFYLKFDRIAQHIEEHGTTPNFAKAMGAVSLAGWTGVLILGRLLPYLGGE